MTTLDPLGSKDRFLTNSIPVDPSLNPADQEQTNINANTTRFNFELRTFQFNGGHGVGRYINDLSSLGGQDGAFDPVTGDFEVLPAFGWFLDYEHMWKRWQRVRDMNLRSSIIWSYVNVNNASFQADDSYHRTQRLGVNLIFSPIKRIDAEVQYIWAPAPTRTASRAKRGRCSSSCCSSSKEAVEADA